MLKSKSDGFTLIELLVSLAGGILVLFAILNIFSFSREALRVGGTRAELIQNTRIALERIARDLRQAETLVYPLPEDDNDPQNPPLSEIEFHDGHDSDALLYIRYHLENETLLRESSYYSFPADPNLHVSHDAVDEFGTSPVKTILDDALVAEHVDLIEFFGEENITTRITVSENTITLTTPTTIFARNLIGT